MSTLRSSSINGCSLGQIPLETMTVFAMPVGPPFGGMTTYTEMLRCSHLFSNGMAHLFDTTPPQHRSNMLRRSAHAVVQAIRLLRLIRKKRAKAVYFMTSDYLGFYEKGVLAVVCKMAGARTVLHPVGSFMNFYGRAGVGRAVIRCLLRTMSAVAVVQPRVRDYILEIAPQTPLWLIPNPVDCSKYGSTFTPRRAQHEVRVMYSGAIVPLKGILDLLEAVHIFKDELVNARFVIIGDGELFDECLHRIDTYGIGHLVEMKGYVEEAQKRELLTSSHLYCLPSHSEGTPISVLEAMASGLPVVATTVGGIPYAVRNGQEGWLVAPGDVHALGRALCYLVKSEAGRNQMGSVGFRRVRELFDIDQVSDLFASHLNQLQVGR